ncbi:hypothetical protein PF011_g19997 [Phytophthora fragariae]|uniref:DDE-1 domain-containing protein n=1 Tax=Phytophthora fragariae TaxID=53985 RepID=A0A6A3J1I1_9STRA|nr:hypothetical protein PF011_g19997 [Phytophthora fragariae]
MLPPNATHIVQPLDVALFCGLSAMCPSSCAAWRARPVPKKCPRKKRWQSCTTKVAGNADAARNGFRVCDLFPPSIPSMHRQLRKVARDRSPHAKMNSGEEEGAATDGVAASCDANADSAATDAYTPAVRRQLAKALRRPREGIFACDMCE